MAVGWSRRKDDEPDHPDHVFIAADVSVDPTVPGSVVIARVPMEPVPYAPPDGLPEPGVIEPTQVFKPWIPSADWPNVTIMYEEFE